MWTHHWLINYHTKRSFHLHMETMCSRSEKRVPWIPPMFTDTSWYPSGTASLPASGRNKATAGWFIQLSVIAWNVLWLKIGMRGMIWQDEQEMQMYSKYKMAQRQWKHRADLGWETKRASIKIMEVVEIRKGGQGELFLSILWHLTLTAFKAMEQTVRYSMGNTGFYMFTIKVCAWTNSI